MVADSCVFSWAVPQSISVLWFMALALCPRHSGCTTLGIVPGQQLTLTLSRIVSNGGHFSGPHHSRYGVRTPVSQSSALVVIATSPIEPAG